MRSWIVLLTLALPLGAQGGAPLPDPDGDGLPTAVEWALGTNPDQPDSDGDGVPDGFEAVAPSGDPIDPTIQKSGSGVRLVVWREGLQAWTFVLLRGPVRRLALEALGTDGPLRLEAHLTEVARTGDLRTLALAFPSALLTALGGALNFALWAERGTGVDFTQGTLLELPRGWGFLEAVGRGTRTVPAERGTARPFPVPAQTPTRTCTQVLERVGTPGRSWVQVIVMEEFCFLAGPFCVLDCGLLLGRTFPWRTNGEGQTFPR